MIPSRPHRGTLALALALTALTAVPVAAQDDKPKHLLRYKYQKGAVGHYNHSQKAQVNANANGRSIDTTMDMQMFMTFDITDVKDGTAAIKVKVYRISMKMNNPMGGNIEFDTKDEDSVPPMFDTVLDVIDQEIELSADDRGRIKIVKVPPPVEQMSRTGVDLEQTFERFMVPLPEEAVAVGDSWNTKTSHKLGSGGELAMDVDNKLLSLQGDEATIGMNMKIALDGPDLPGKVDIDQATGKTKLDLGTGLQKGTDVNMKISMNMSQGAMNMDMKMNMDMAIVQVAAPAKGEKEGKDEAKNQQK